MTKKDFVCEYEGCDFGAMTGHALYRTSPMGTPFVGRCGLHMGESVDPTTAEIVGAIEDRNILMRSEA